MPDFFNRNYYYFCPRTTFEFVGQCLHGEYTAVCTHRATGSLYSEHGSQQTETHFSRDTVAAHQENDHVSCVFEPNSLLSLSLFYGLLEEVKFGTFKHA